MSSKPKCHTLPFPNESERPTNQIQRTGRGRFSFVFCVLGARSLIWNVRSLKEFKPNRRFAQGPFARYQASQTVDAQLSSLAAARLLMFTFIKPRD